jgi:chromosome segregation ATPase
MPNTNHDEQDRMSATRLDRIENKIDRLSEAMIDLARAEEKLVNFERFNQQLLDRVEANNTKLHSRIDDLKKETNANTSTVKLVNRISLVALTAVTAVVIKLVLGTSV